MFLLLFGNFLRQQIKKEAKKKQMGFFNKLISTPIQFPLNRFFFRIPCAFSGLYWVLPSFIEFQ